MWHLGLQTLQMHGFEFEIGAFYADFHVLHPHVIENKEYNLIFTNFLCHPSMQLTHLCRQAQR